MIIMKLNRVTIQRTNDNECPACFYFNDSLEAGGYVFLDLEQIAIYLGRQILDDNDDPNDICTEEIYAWIEQMYFDNLTERIKEDIWEYIENNQ